MRFNQVKEFTLKTTNYEGGSAYNHISPEHELYARVGTCLVKEPKFYGDSNEELEIIKQLVRDIAKEVGGPRFIMQLATYTRNVLHLRSIPIVLMGTLSLYSYPINKNDVKVFVPSVIKRADELAETIAFIRSEIGPIGNEKPKMIGIFIATNEFTSD